MKISYWFSLPFIRLSKLFEDDNTVDKAFGLVGAIFWLFVAFVMYPIGPLPIFVIFGIALAVYLAVSGGMRLMTESPNIFIFVMLILAMIFTYIYVGLSSLQ